MNKNLKDRADRLLSSIYLDGYEHGYKDAIKNISNFMKLEPDNCGNYTIMQFITTHSPVIKADKESEDSDE